MFDWAVRLLNEHPDLETTLCAARCRWMTGDTARAAADFEALAGRETDEHAQAYLNACARAARGTP
jgi:hypothetical protein